MERKSSLGLCIIGLASVLVLAACGGGSDINLGDAGATGANGTTGASGVTGAHGTTAIGPELESQTELTAKSLALGQPIYWAGPQKGFDYEFMRTANSNVYVRYLPRGVEVGGKPGQLLIVATYPMNNAYASIKKASSGKGGVVAGTNGSIVWVRADDPKSVYVAWPDVPYEVEVYSPDPSTAAEIAESGRVTTVA